MTISAYLWLAGSRQGDIQGPVVDPQREGTIRVLAYDHEMLIPSQQSSIGAVTSRITVPLQREPVTISKTLDQTSLPLVSALVDQETMDTWRLQLWRMERTGFMAAFTIELHNARIVGIHTEMAEDLDRDAKGMETLEHVTFAYDRMTWTDESRGVTVEDQIT